MKNWNNNASYTYSAIGYTSWTTPEVTNITDAKLTIKRNQFINAGKVNFTKVTEGSVNVAKTTGKAWTCPAM